MSHNECDPVGGILTLFLIHPDCINLIEIMFLAIGTTYNDWDAKGSLHFMFVLLVKGDQAELVRAIIYLKNASTDEYLFPVHLEHSFRSLCLVS